VARGTRNSSPQKCDRADGSGEVRFAPKADMPLHRSEVTRCANSGLMHRDKYPSFDHFVGDRKQRRGMVVPQFEFSWS